MALRPSSFGTLVYNEVTSRVTKRLVFYRLEISFNFEIKSVVSLIYEGASIIYILILASMYSVY